MRILAILGGVISLFMAMGIFIVTGLLAWEPISHPVIGPANISFHGRHIIFTGQAIHLSWLIPFVVGAVLFFVGIRLVSGRRKSSNQSVQPTRESFRDG